MARWRKPSSARRLAVVVSQAPGLCGTPSRGQCSSAATSASAAHSSAMPTSRVMRATAPMTLADSSRQTAAIASCVVWVAACTALPGPAAHGPHTGKSKNVCKPLCHRGGSIQGALKASNVGPLDLGLVVTLDKQRSRCAGMPAASLSALALTMIMKRILNRPPFRPTTNGAV